MSSAADPHSILNRNPELGRFQTPAPKPKVTRYFAGKAPEWQKNEDSDDDIFPQEHDLKSLGDTSITSEKLNQRLALIEDKAFTSHKPEERRVIRSEKVEKKPEKIEKKEKIKEPKKEISNNGSVVTKELKIDESSVEIVRSNEVEDRRAALKARLLAKEGTQSEMINEKNHGGSEIIERSSTEIVKKNSEVEKNDMEVEEEEEEEDIVEEYEEEGGIINIMKPIYVKKEERTGMNDKQVVG